MRVLVTDQVFGGIEIERSILEPAGVTLEEAPSTDEATLTRLAEGTAGLLVCYAPITDAVLEEPAEAYDVLAEGMDSADADIDVEIVAE